MILFERNIKRTILTLHHFNHGLLMTDLMSNLHNPRPNKNLEEKSFSLVWLLILRQVYSTTIMDQMQQISANPCQGQTKTSTRIRKETFY